ncbi:hypothetical protein PMAYCL1PPCAC_11510, partial [Pristionchus mayeri]
LIVMDVGTRPVSNHPYPKATVDVPYWPGLADDHPVSIQAASKLGLVFIVTKHGFAHVFDLESATILCSERITDSPFFASAEYWRGGIIGVNERGQVLSVTIDKEKMAKHMNQTNPWLAGRLARRWDLSTFIRSLDEIDDGASDSGRESDASSIAPPSPYNLPRRNHLANPSFRNDPKTRIKRFDLMLKKSPLLEIQSEITLRKEE